jgi:hypothetical protein
MSLSAQYHARVDVLTAIAKMIPDNPGKWTGDEFDGERVRHMAATRAREVLEAFNLLVEIWKVPPQEVVRILKS